MLTHPSSLVLSNHMPLGLSIEVYTWEFMAVGGISYFDLDHPKSHSQKFRERRLKASYMYVPRLSS